LATQFHQLFISQAVVAAAWVLMARAAAQVDLAAAQRVLELRPMAIQERHLLAVAVAVQDSMTLTKLVQQPHWVRQMQGMVVQESLFSDTKFDKQLRRLLE
jgi:hypothetical protein